ncbi:hypothetical protein YTPLAS72_07950 [Nitrospira sp.]|nr:hypothetical protein YTPLAS72_07950 [Nitrospira sp.]
MSCEMADELLKEQIVDNPNARRLILTADLTHETKGELMKGEKMDIEECTLSFTTKQSFDAIKQRARWDQNRNRGEGVLRLGMTDVIDEG